MLPRIAGPLLTCVLLHVAIGTAPAAAQAQGESLYKRMGGYDVIAAVVDDFFGRFGADPQLAPFLGGLNAAAGARVRQNFIDFFCAQTGGPCVYNGRDMRAAHTGLAIRDAHFDAVMRHFEAALMAQDVGARERQDMLTMLRSLKADIVQG
jgi:hemoglobin